LPSVAPVGKYSVWSAKGLPSTFGSWWAGGQAGSGQCAGGLVGGLAVVSWWVFGWWPGGVESWRGSSLVGL
jgi:hypothetical protein